VRESAWTCGRLALTKEPLIRASDPPRSAGSDTAWVGLAGSESVSFADDFGTMLFAEACVTMSCAASRRRFVTRLASFNARLSRVRGTAVVTNACLGLIVYYEYCLWKVT
jgi:hypothetical protein